LIDCEGICAVIVKILGIAPGCVIPELQSVVTVELFLHGYEYFIVKVCQCFVSFASFQSVTCQTGMVFVQQRLSNVHIATNSDNNLGLLKGIGVADWGTA
jgi:hypothetical protein